MTNMDLGQRYWSLGLQCIGNPFKAWTPSPENSSPRSFRTPYHLHASHFPCSTPAALVAKCLKTEASLTSQCLAQSHHTPSLPPNNSIFPEGLVEKESLFALKHTDQFSNVPQYLIASEECSYQMGPYVAENNPPLGRVRLTITASDPQASMSASVCKAESFQKKQDSVSVAC